MLFLDALENLSTTALLFEKEKKELLELLTKLNYPTEEIKTLIEFTFQNQTLSTTFSETGFKRLQFCESPIRGKKANNQEYLIHFNFQK